MKKSAIIMAAALLTALFLFLAVLAAGCGKAAAPEERQEAEGTGDVTRQESAIEGEAEGEETRTGPTSPATPSDSATDDSRVDGGDETYSFGPLQEGMGFPPERLQVVDVRWADHGDYFRIVFDIREMDGSDSDYVPLFGVSYNPDHLSFAMHIDNVAINDPDFATLGDYVIIGDAVVESIAQVMGASSLEGTFSVRLNAPRGCRLSYVTGPLRLIVDIEK